MSSRSLFDDLEYVDFQPPASRPLSSTLGELLDKAAEGDLNAATQVLSYLTAGLYDLRQIMNHAIHDHGSVRLWRCLLVYIAVGEWGEWDPLGDGTETRQRRLSWKEPRSGAAADAIIDLFLHDQGANEADQKGIVLRRALHGPQPVRYAGACLLGMRGDPAAIPLLEEMVCGRGETRPANEAWQVYAVRALGALSDARGAPALLCGLTSSSRLVHQASARALRELGPAGRDVLLEALRHPDSHIRWHAARSLGQIGDLRAVETLVVGLRDEHQAVRWATADTLAQIDTPAIPAILKEIIRLPVDERFRQAVYHALHAMTSDAARRLLKPLLSALRDPTAAYEAPVIAQRILAQWVAAPTDAREG